MTISSPTKLVFPAPHFISTSTSTTTHHDSCSTMIPFGGQTTLPPLSGHREKRAAASPPSLYITHVRSHCCSTLNDVWDLFPSHFFSPLSSDYLGSLFHPSAIPHPFICPSIVRSEHLTKASGSCCWVPSCGELLSSVP